MSNSSATGAICSAVAELAITSVCPMWRCACTSRQASGKIVPAICLQKRRFQVPAHSSRASPVIRPAMLRSIASKSAVVGCFSLENATRSANSSRSTALRLSLSR
ncbi:hypothetical protein D0B54_21440 [Solimonas sp. K1W22B-7]|nr:hypothetical protein D0B54_21440 [Solimonas sp. K1W22B-7]